MKMHMDFIRKVGKITLNDTKSECIWSLMNFRNCFRVFCYVVDYNSNNTGIKNIYMYESEKSNDENKQNEIYDKVNMKII